MSVQTSPKKAHELSVLNHLNNVQYDGFFYEPFDGANPFHVELFKSKFDGLRRWLTADGWTTETANVHSGNNSRLFDGVQFTVNNKGEKVYHDLVSVKSLGIVEGGKSGLNNCKIEIGKGVSAFESKALIVDGAFSGCTTFKVVLVWFTHSTQTRMYFDMIDVARVLNLENESETCSTNMQEYAELFGLKRPNAHFANVDGFYFTAKRKGGKITKGRVYTGLFLKSEWIKAKAIKKVSECSEYYQRRLATALARRERNKGQ